MNMKQPKFRRRAAQRPDEVLDSAMSLFLERGYEATRMDDVAARAGISKGAVYRYFPSKQALLEGLVTRGLVPLSEKLTRMVDNYSGNPQKAIATMVRLLARRATQAKVIAVPKIIIREAIVVPEIAEMYSEAVIRPVLKALSFFIQKGIEEKKFQPVDPELSARSIMGPMIAHILLSEVFQLRPQGGLRFEELAENHLEILFNGLYPREADHDPAI